MISVTYITKANINPLVKVIIEIMAGFAQQKNAERKFDGN